MRPLNRNPTNNKAQKDIFQTLMLYPSKLSFKTDEKTGTFKDKHELEQFTSTKPTALQKIHENPNAEDEETSPNNNPKCK